MGALDLDNTVLLKEGSAKAARGSPEMDEIYGKEPTGKWTEEGTGVKRSPGGVPKVSAFKNGEMGANRVWSPAEADAIADKVGLFDFGTEWNKFWRGASPRLIDPELAAGEAGKFGEKGKLFDGRTPKALPEAPQQRFNQ